MPIPEAEGAQVAIEKLHDYCLSTEHPYGRHKARVFAAALGLSRENADQLRDALLFAVRVYDAALGTRDAFGQRYVVDFPMEGPGGTALVRSTWIIHREEGFPRLITCYVL